jgi:hypothetical protein
MVEVALLLEVAHGVPDGSRRHTEPELMSEAPRASRLSCLDVGLDYGFENPPFPLIESR